VGDTRCVIPQMTQVIRQLVFELSGIQRMQTRERVGRGAGGGGLERAATGGAKLEMIRLKFLLHRVHRIEHCEIDDRRLAFAGSAGRCRGYCLCVPVSDDVRMRLSDCAGLQEYERDRLPTDSIDLHDPSSLRKRGGGSGTSLRLTSPESVGSQTARPSLRIERTCASSLMPSQRGRALRARAV